MLLKSAPPVGGACACRGVGLALSGSKISEPAQRIAHQSRGHFDLFNTIRLEYLKDPYPAWTAAEIAGLRREGAIVEIRVIANTDPGS